MRKINWIRIIVVANFLMTLWLIWAVVSLAKLEAALGASLDFLSQVVGRIVRFV